MTLRTHLNWCPPYLQLLLHGRPVGLLRASGLSVAGPYCPMRRYLGLFDLFARSSHPLLFGSIWSIRSLMYLVYWSIRSMIDLHGLLALCYLDLFDLFDLWSIQSIDLFDLWLIRTAFSPSAIWIYLIYSIFVLLTSTLALWFADTPLSLGPSVVPRH